MSQDELEDNAFFRGVSLLNAIVRAGAQITDWQGHNKRGTISWGDPANFVKRIIGDLFIYINEEDDKRLRGVLEGGPPLTTPHRLGRPSGLRCYYCGERLEIATDGRNFSVSGPPCPLPNGLEFHDIELNVPSGILVVDDDLRRWYPLERDWEINELPGKIKMIEDHAAVGLAMGFVGNSCPNLRRAGDQKFVVARYLEHVWDPNQEVEVDNPAANPWGEVLANVCTDLWWYSIADGDDFARRLAHFTPEISLEDWAAGYTHNLVRVPPGVYRVRWFPDSYKDEDTQGAILYAEIEWVRPPDPVTDHLQAYLGQNNTALESCIQEILDDSRSLDWVFLSPEQREQHLARAADRLMCVIGGGVDWHERGFPLMNISERARELAQEISSEGVVPLFNSKMHWYPFSAGYGGLCLGAGVMSGFGRGPEIPLNPSFALLGLNIARNYIQHPPEPRLNREAYPPEFGIAEVRNRMLLALSCYRGIRERTEVEPQDPQFDAWALSEGAEGEIRERDLGPLHPPEGEWGPIPPLLEMSGDKFVEFKFNPRSSAQNACWHPRSPHVGGSWATPESAQRWALPHCSENQESYAVTAKHSVPLHFVARIIGTESTPRGILLLVEFDFGHTQMTGENPHKWAIDNASLPFLKSFSNEEEYAQLLLQCREEFQKVEEQFPPQKGA